MVTARSKHTDPRDIRAERRLQSPREPRSAGDPSRRNRTGRLLKELGLQHTFIESGEPARPVQPRIIRRPPRPGYLHPLEKAGLQQVLEFVGPEALYGLRSVTLAQTPAKASSKLPQFGRLLIPGRIKLFEQPEPPWRLPGLLAEEEANRLQRAGAVLDTSQAQGATIIRWPGDTLRDFMIFEVLLHELGHHLLQHDKGKRTERIARTRDHEAFARRFADRCRAEWLEAGRFD